MWLESISTRSSLCSSVPRQLPLQTERRTVRGEEAGNDEHRLALRRTAFAKMAECPPESADDRNAFPPEQVRRRCFVFGRVPGRQGQNLQKLALHQIPH